MVERGTGRPDEYLLDGKRVPSVTEILSRFKESSKLINWSWRQGLVGLDYTQTRDKAAFIGTCVHEACELVIHGEEWVPKADQQHVADKVHRAAKAFKLWYDRCTYKQWLATELPLVSRKYRFAGTLDGAIGQDDGTHMWDIKTSKSIYSDHILQLGAYSLLWEEIKLDPVKGGVIVRVSPGSDDGKTPASVKVSTFDQQTIAMAAHTFLLMRQLFTMVDRFELLAKKGTRP